MKFYACVVLCVVVAACGRPKENPNSGGTSTPRVVTQVVGNQGAVVPSGDRKFSLAIPTGAFLSDVTIRVERLAEAEGDAPTHTAIYRTSYEPIDVALESGSLLIASFVIADGTGDSQTLRMAHRDGDGAFDTYFPVRVDDVAWSSVLTFGDFAIVDAPPVCDCDNSDGCDSGCECDADCVDNCLPTQVACDGECLSASVKCDGFADCSDDSDEADCSLCGADEWECNNGECLDADWECDGITDCADGSDEDGHCDGGGACLSWQWECGSGECIDADWECDGISDCDDVSDEDAHCEDGGSCTSSQWACDSGQCIDADWECDGFDDCFDGSDEDLHCGALDELDAYEPDDAFLTAKVIVAGETQTHSLHTTADLDYVKFTLTGWAAVTLETGGFDGDTELFLYSASFAQIGYDDEGGVGSFSKITVAALAPGTYYAMVRSFLHETTESYTLALTATPTQSPLLPPTGLTATLVGGRVELAWNAMADATGYRVSYDDDAVAPVDPWPYAAEGAPPLDTVTNAFTLRGLAGGRTWYVSVTTLRDSAESAAQKVSIAVPIAADAYEPDNTVATARVLEQNEVQLHTLHAPTDVDLWIFTVTEAAPLTLATVGCDAAAILSVEDLLGTLLARGTGDAFEPCATITRDFEPGDYVVGVAARDAGVLLSYGIRASAPGGLPDAFEPDDTMGTASVLAWDVLAAHSLHAPGDVDMMALTLVAPSWVELTLSHEAATAFAELVLVNAAGVEMAAASTHGTDLSLVAPELAAGTYYAKVSGAQSLSMGSYSIVAHRWVYPLPPANLVAVAGAGSITLSWDAVAGADSYRVYYDDDANNPPYSPLVLAVEGASPIGTSAVGLTLTGLPTTAYHLVVTALHGPTESLASADVSATPLAAE